MVIDRITGLLELHLRGPKKPPKSLCGLRLTQTPNPFHAARFDSRSL
jgi:hypothetical protein